MDKQEIQNKIKELEKRLTELKEELNKPESKVFKPKYGCTYYYITTDGMVSMSRENCDAIDIGRYAIGNCFKTQEEADFEAERLKVIAELKRFAQKHNETIDWKDTHNYKWYLCYDNDNYQIRIGFAMCVTYGIIYFSSKELAEQAMKEIGEERIKKYYLGVID